MADRRIQQDAEPHPRQMMRQLGLRPSRRLGQNFLVSGRTLDRIVELSGLSGREVVLEVGTGLGRLAARLAARAGRLVTVEVDRALHAAAQARLAPLENVTSLWCDFLSGKHAINPEVERAVREALAAPRGALKVVSNLPYCISSPALVALLEWELAPEELCLMLQKEVADRVLAGPGTATYGPLSAFVGYWARAERLMSVPRRAFWPQPAVSSSLLRLVRTRTREQASGYADFARVVRTLFTARRKSIGHALRARWGPAATEQVTAATGLAPSERVERLGVAELEQIARLLGPPRRGAAGRGRKAR